jgi:hypothetical protein
MAGQKHYLKSQAVLMELFYGPNAVHNPAVIAAQINVPYKTLNKYIQGVTACPVEILVAIYEVTEFDPIRQLLTPAGYSLQLLLPSMADKATLEGEIMDDIVELTKLCQLYREYMADGRLTPAEYSSLLESLQDIFEECTRHSKRYWIWRHIRPLN